MRVDGWVAQHCTAEQPVDQLSGLPSLTPSPFSLSEMNSTTGPRRRFGHGVDRADAGIDRPSLQSDQRIDGNDKVFDRDMGKAISPEDLRSYAEVLRAYHLHPETKFLGGGSSQSGVLRRRHIMAGPILYIGKEADQLEEADEYGFQDELVTDYDPVNADWSAQRAVIAATKISRLKAEAHVGHQTIAERDGSAAKRSDDLVDWAIDWTNEHSVSDLASILPYDADNLRKVLNRSAKASAKLLDRIEQAMGSDPAADRAS